MSSFAPVTTTPEIRLVGSQGRKLPAGLLETRLEPHLNLETLYFKLG
jgi:hypothetical protein